MKGQKFFSKLRDEFLALASSGPPVFVYFEADGPSLSEWADRVQRARLEELMAQVALASDSPIASETPALSVGLEMLRAYCDDTKHPHLYSVDDDGVVAGHKRVGVALPVIGDVCAVGADFCERLQTSSLAWHRARPTRRTHRQSNHKHGRAGAVSDTKGNVFMRDGDGWIVIFGGVKKTVPATLKGFDLLRKLLGTPQTSIPALELLDRVQTLSNGDRVHDAQAGRAYDAEIIELQNSLEIARDTANPSRASEIEEQLMQIHKHRKSSRRLDGRPRQLGADFERARQAASKQFQVALRRLEKIHPRFAAHVARSVKAGSSFIYAPAEDMVWKT